MTCLPKIEPDPELEYNAIPTGGIDAKAIYGRADSGYLERGRKSLSTPPKIRPSKTSQFLLRYPKGSRDEKEQVYGESDCLCSQRGGGRHSRCGSMPQTRHQLQHLLRLEKEVWWYGRFRTQTAQRALSRECQTQTNVCRYGAGVSCTQGSDRKKALTPDVKEDAVRYLHQEHGLSVRRASRILGVNRSSLYRPKTTRDDTPLIDELG